MSMTPEESYRVVSILPHGRLMTLDGFFYRYDASTRILYGPWGDVLRNYPANVIEVSFKSADHLDGMRVGEGL